MRQVLVPLRQINMPATFSIDFQVINMLLENVFPINFFRVIYLCRFCNNLVPNLNHLTDLCMVQIIILLHLHCMMNWFNLWQKVFRIQMHSQDISKKKSVGQDGHHCLTQFSLFDILNSFVWYRLGYNFPNLHMTDCNWFA